jgi:hypothetical protein
MGCDLQILFCCPIASRFAVGLQALMITSALVILGMVIIGVSSITFFCFACLVQALVAHPLLLGRGRRGKQYRDTILEEAEDLAPFWSGASLLCVIG